MGSATKIVAVDIGGTNARFTLAELANGRVLSLGSTVTLSTRAHASLDEAWAVFRDQMGGSLPCAAAIAIAAPVRGEVITLTNANHWVIRPAKLAAALAVDDLILVNDFEAVGHAAAAGSEQDFAAICGPDSVPADGVISVVGPGTGLGVAWVLRHNGGHHVQATEGGHIAFAPVDAIEHAVKTHLQQQHGRVSAERAICGGGITAFYAAVAAARNEAVTTPDDRTIWRLIAEGRDVLAMATAEHFCRALGSVAGDIALAQGATSVVIAGGVGERLRAILPNSGFAERFCAKGRYRDYMAAIPVRSILLEQPGLFGAAAAFALRDAT